jgi:hypothetical protein
MHTVSAIVSQIIWVITPCSAVRALCFVARYYIHLLGKSVSKPRNQKNRATNFAPAYRLLLIPSRRTIRPWTSRRYMFLRNAGLLPNRAVLKPKITAILKYYKYFFPVYKTEIMVVGDPPHWPCDTPLSVKVDTNFEDKRRSLED